MALTFDVSNIKDHETVTTHPEDLGKKEGRRWHPITDMLIGASMGVELGTIEEKNVDEWVWRLAFLQSLRGPHAHLGDKPLYLRQGDVEKHIGLRTNVTTVASRHSWLNGRCKHASPNSFSCGPMTKATSAYDLFQAAYEAVAAEAEAEAAEAEAKIFS